jgi:predicted RNase H-like HicB family nuclease
MPSTMATEDANASQRARRTHDEDDSVTSMVGPYYPKALCQPPNRQYRQDAIIALAMKLTAVFMKVPEGYVAFIEELPGANIQGETLEQARENLHEAVALVLDANRALTEQSLEGAAVVREAFVLPMA